MLWQKRILPVNAAKFKQHGIKSVSMNDWHVSLLVYTLIEDLLISWYDEHCRILTWWCSQPAPGGHIAVLYDARRRSHTLQKRCWTTCISRAVAQHANNGFAFREYWNVLQIVLHYMMKYTPDTSFVPAGPCFANHDIMLRGVLSEKYVSVRRTYE